MGGLGVFGDNFYTGTQNGSKLDIWWNRFLIHTFELKLWPFEVSPCVCTGMQCFVSK